MTETPWPKLAQIWLRHPKKILCSLFDSTHLRLRHALNNVQKNLGRLSHITANSGSSVSIISVSAVNLSSHSYRSYLGHQWGLLIYYYYIYCAVWQDLNLGPNAQVGFCYPRYSWHASVPANYLKLSPNILRNFINEKLRTLEKLYDHWDIWLNTTSGITRINVNSWLNFRMW